jgi:calcium-dependent protein kinase
LEELKKYKKVSVAQDLIKEFIASQIVCYDDSQSVIAAFQKIDANWDGRLSKDELLKHYKESMDEATAQKIVQQIFETADRDKNGYIEYSEFVKASMKAQSLISFTNIDKAFKLLDSDRNLKISSEELKLILEDSSDSNLFKLIKEADKNNDGEIDFSEFYDLIKKNYSS